MKGSNKVWHAGRASQAELDEIDRCRLCEIVPEFEHVCRAVKYCHRQLKMELEEEAHGDPDQHI